MTNDRKDAFYFCRRLRPSFCTTLRECRNTFGFVYDPKLPACSLSSRPRSS